jgi:hypothetical protein
MKQVLVQGHCSQQDGSVTTIDGFYFQNYTRSLQNGNEVLTPLGSPCVSIFCVPLSLYLCMCGFFFFCECAQKYFARCTLRCPRHWLVRFTPTQASNYSCYLTVTTPSGTNKTGEWTFQVFFFSHTLSFYLYLSLSFSFTRSFERMNVSVMIFKRWYPLPPAVADSYA